MMVNVKLNELDTDRLSTYVLTARCVASAESLLPLSVPSVEMEVTCWPLMVPSRRLSATTSPAYTVLLLFE